MANVLTNDTDLLPRTLATQVVDILTQDLMFRRIRPGQTLREADLSERFGVSRPAIRDAMTRLELQGLIEIVPRKGARATVYAPDELDDLVTYHAAIFACTCRLAAIRRTAGQSSDLEQAVAHLLRLANSDAGAEAFELSRLTCYHLVERATGTAFSLNQRRAFITRMRHPYSIDAVATRDQRQSSAARWMTLFHLIAAHDGAGAERHFLTMVEATRPAILAACASARAITSS